jgi:FkbM family methyltransferase
MTFRHDFDAWWPNYDHAPETCFKFVQRGLPDIDIAARMCPQRRIAIQAGAHAGFWPRRLSQLFRMVYAFECEPVLFECARLNLKRWQVKNVTLSPCGLSSADGQARMVPHRSAGGWSIDRDGSVPVSVTTIDALRLTTLDAVYLDIEGHETAALEGGADTIKRCRPMIHVEELPDSAAAIELHMAAIGYVRTATAHKDVIFRPEEKTWEKT